MRSKVVNIRNLPKKLQSVIFNEIKKSNNDLPKIVIVGTFKCICWTNDLPVEFIS